MNFLRVVAICFSFFPCTTGALAADWPPLDAEEVKMTTEANTPGAPAIYLFRQVDRDDTNSREHNYVRIKVLKEEGRKYGDVELEYVKGLSNVRDIKARTIRPDGTILNFDGKPYDKTVIKAKGVRYLAKTFTMPDVQVGSIIEYSYEYDWSEYLVYDSHWILSEDLFTKHAVFSLKPARFLTCLWTWQGLPSGAKPPFNDKGVIRLDIHDIPAFETEDYMPPENQLKARVDFTYSRNAETDPKKYWQQIGKALNEAVEHFIDKRKAMEQAVAQTIAPSDSPEVKLQKLYARTQQIRNLTFEQEKTSQEQKREKVKDINSVEDVWKRGYGDGGDITWLFLALARSAGFEAYPVYVSRRNQYFFDPQLRDINRLNDTVVLVKLNGKDLYFDPGTAFTPFGLLPWPETAVAGLKLDKEGGSWIKTPMPESSDSTIVRRAELRVSETGDVEGKVTVTYTGLEALWRRLEENWEDDADRRKFLEDEVRSYVPASADIALTNKPEWQSSAPALVAEFTLKVSGWVSSAGRRQLMPVGFFTAGEKHVFEQGTRVHPIYFHFFSENIDDVTVELPAGWDVGQLPTAQTNDGRVVLYSFKVEKDGSRIHLSRKLDLGILFMDQKYYPALRNFFQVVRTGDDQQIILEASSATAKN